MESAVWAIAPGASHEFPWDGQVRVRLTEPDEKNHPDAAEPVTPRMGVCLA
jgi:hypothetical protein